jgi:hypothetical protein
MVSDHYQKQQAREHIGAPLRQAREAAGLSIEDASYHLAIPVSHLSALEEGDFSRFSAQVYARGAYVKYAAWLGLDTKQAQRDVLRALAPARHNVPLRVHTPEVWYKRLIGPRLFIIGTGSFIACLVGGYIIWHIRSFWQLPTLELAATRSDVVQEDSVTVRGRSESGVRVRLNGEAVLLREDDTFEVLLDIHPGINIIQLEAENAAGRKRIVERHILRSRYVEEQG